YLRGRSYDFLPYQRARLGTRRKTPASRTSSAAGFASRNAARTRRHCHDGSLLAKDRVAEGAASHLSQDDLPVGFKVLRLRCVYLHDYRLLAYFHLDFGRAGLLRRTDDAGYICLSYLSCAAGHDQLQVGTSAVRRG